MQRTIELLKNADIEPETNQTIFNEPVEDSKLLQRVKLRAHNLLKEKDALKESEMTTIAYALNN